MHVSFPLTGHLKEQRCRHFHIFRSKCSTLKVQRKQKPNVVKIKTTFHNFVRWPWLWTVTLRPRCEASRGPDLLLSPRQSENLWSWSVEFWSWGQTNRRTRRWSPQSNMPRWLSPASLWPYLEMWLLAHLRNSLPGGSRGSIRSAESQHNYSTPS